jgi:ABC-type molybdate transport system permease subunit
MLAVYILLAIGFLRLGASLRQRFPGVVGSRFSGTVHILALLAFLIGCLLTWMAYSSDHPSKERQLLLPLVLPLCVYGFVLLIWLRVTAMGLIGRVLSRLFSGSSG